MDDEWVDYQWALEQYERQRLREQADQLPTTIGVDLGTIYLKLSHTQPQQPELIPTAQGDRYRFTGIVYSSHQHQQQQQQQQHQHANEKDNEDHHHHYQEWTIVTGRSAMDKFFYKPKDSTAYETVLLPYAQLQSSTHEEAGRIVQKVILPAVSEAMERISDKREARTVLTLPPAFYNQHHTSIFSNFQDEHNRTISLPEPVAAIWGAQSLDLLPTKQSKDDAPLYLVLDVGGLATTASLVQHDRVLASSTIERMGGETMVQQIGHLILKEALDISPSLKDDPMSLALIQQQARASCLELVTKTSTHIHIPYLYMGRRPENPHLDMHLSRTVVEQAMQDVVRDELVPQIRSMPNEDILSTSMAHPTHVSALMTSVITKLLEVTGHTPGTLDHVLLVGGGSKHRFFEQSCRDSLALLLGPHDKLVVPNSAIRQDLTALGAACLLPNYTYSYDRGLDRT